MCVRSWGVISISMVGVFGQKVKISCENSLSAVVCHISFLILTKNASVHYLGNIYNFSTVYEIVLIKSKQAKCMYSEKKISIQMATRSILN